MTTPVILSAGATHVGRVRKDNEDAMVIRPESGLFAVADGMGGVAGGAFASNDLLAAVGDATRQFESSAPLDVRIAHFREAVNRANQSIRSWAENHGVSGTGSTLVLLTFDPRRPEFAALLHAGDSRAYLLRDGNLQQLTRDHSAAASFGDGSEASVPALFRNVVTNAIGMSADVQLDETLISLRTGDTVVLCSDGLYRMVDDQELVTILSAPVHIESRAQALIDAANRNGGKDNITAVLVHVGLPPGETRSGSTDSETHDTDMRSALEAAREARAPDRNVSHSLTNELSPKPSPPLQVLEPPPSRRSWMWIVAFVTAFAVAGFAAYRVLVTERTSGTPATPATEAIVSTPEPESVVDEPVGSLVRHAVLTGDWNIPPEKLAGYVADEGGPSPDVVRAWMDLWHAVHGDLPGAMDEFIACREAIETIVRVWNPSFSAPPVSAEVVEYPAPGANALCLARANLQSVFFADLDTYVSTAALVLGAFGRSPADTETLLRQASGMHIGDPPALPGQLESLRNLVRSLNRWKERTREMPVGMTELRNLATTFLEPVESGVRELFLETAEYAKAIPAPRNIPGAREEVRDFYAQRDGFVAAIEGRAHASGLERDRLAMDLRSLLASPALKDAPEKRVAEKE